MNARFDSINVFLLDSYKSFHVEIKLFIYTLVNFFGTDSLLRSQLSSLFLKVLTELTETTLSGSL